LDNIGLFKPREEHVLRKELRFIVKALAHFALERRIL
jgi:hypothetical protein